MAYFPGLDDEDDDAKRKRERRQAIMGEVFATNVQLQLKSFGAILLRQRRIALLVAGVVSLLAIVGALLVQPLYTAQSSLILKLGREFLYRSEVADDEPTKAFSLKELINSEVEILNSRDLAEQVVEELGVERLYPDIAEDEPDTELAFAKAVLALRDMTSARSVLESSVLKISFTHHDRELAAEATNLLVERFKDKHLEIFREHRSDFLEGELQRYRGELTTADDAVGVFKEERGVYDAEQQRAMLITEHVEIDALYRDVRLRITQIEHGGLGPNGRRIPGIGANQRDERRPLEEAYVRLMDLRVREQELLVGYLETSRPVLGVRQEIRAVDEFIFDLQTQELRGLQAKEEIILNRRKRLDEEIRALDLNERSLQELQRDVVAIESILQTYRRRYEEARITESLDRQKRINLRVIERAAPPLQPTGLSRKIRIVLGLLVGGIAGVSVAFFRELTRVA